MDIKAIADQLTAAVGTAPETLQALLSDPAQAIQDVTGQALDPDQIHQVVDEVRARIAGGEIDLSQFDLSSIDLGSIDLRALGVDSLSELVGGAGGALGAAASGLIGKLGGLFGR